MAETNTNENPAQTQEQPNAGAAPKPNGIEGIAAAAGIDKQPAVIPEQKGMSEFTKGMLIGCGIGAAAVGGIWAAVAYFGGDEVSE